MRSRRLPVPCLSYDRAADLPVPFTFVVAEGAVDRHGDDRADARRPVGGRDRRWSRRGGRQGCARDRRRGSHGTPDRRRQAKGQPKGVVVVFFSVDGGWRDLDKTIGDWLTAEASR